MTVNEEIEDLILGYQEKAERASYTARCIDEDGYTRRMADHRADILYGVISDLESIIGRS